ncbi:hypothetical protein ACFV16_38295 [Streptomyces massasporeus]|uniref:hypothetical protein n=1 Tax=Streptomyces massasporeus TaxID=67324 RepID=UPI0036B85D0B
MALAHAGGRAGGLDRYERAFFESVHHRVENFIMGILLPHQKKLDDPYICTVMAQMGAIESTLHLLAKLE